MPRLTTRTYDPKSDRGIWWGGSASPPTQVVRELEVWYKGRAVPVRHSAIAGLAQAQRVQFRPMPKQILPVIEGGDAADSYVCRVEIRNGKVMVRTVEDGEDRALHAPCLMLPA